MPTPPALPAALDALLLAMPKAELHVHIEGTLEPELLFELAERNGVTLPYADVAAARAAYAFTDLQSFLDVYYAGAAVLLHERDFYDLAWAYLRRAAAENVRHAELFFDPQTHTHRGVPLAAVIGGLHAACEAARRDLGVDASLILCFLRHLDEDDALATLDAALPFRDRFVGVGLDSGERGNPPEKFTRVFARAAALGLRLVAHAGEEGPPAYVWGALDALGVERVDHGVRSVEDPALLARLALERVPLTVCPLSNLKLCVVADLADHPLRRLLDAGIVATVNSDDPAYFGGYVVENYRQTFRALGLGAPDAYTLARNSFLASFVDDATRATWLAELDACFAAHTAAAPAPPAPPASLDNRRPVTPEVAAFWAAACAAAGLDPAQPYQVWFFGDREPMATELALLVRDGPKRATAALKAAVDVTPETAPVVGLCSVVTDFAGAPIVVIRTTRVDVVPFEAVDAAFAWEEGEGDRTLDDWRAGHWRFFEAECRELGLERSPGMEIVCERFEKLYP